MTEALVLFAGAGGSTLGIEAAGYATVGVDNWRLAADTHAANGLTFVQADLIADKLDWLDRFASVPLLWASPPCQPFTNSTALTGRWDPRDGMPATIATIDRVRPPLAIVENVAGLTQHRHAEYLAFVLASIAELGYTVDHRLIDAADHGVPQHRRRLLIVARRDGAPLWPTPEPTRVTVREAIGDGTDNPPGARVVYLKHPVIYPGSWRGSLLYNGRGRPLILDEPSLSVYASGGNHVHWFDLDGQHRPYFEHLRDGGAVRVGDVPGTRRLTVEQMAALQAFPASHVFAGKPSAQVRQIGNAVPPPLARAVVDVNR